MTSVLRNARKFKRRCVVCRAYQAAAEMWRLRASSFKEALTTSETGRSAYLCKEARCLETLLSKKGRPLSHALRCSISIETLKLKISLL